MCCAFGNLCCAWVQNNVDWYEGGLHHDRLELIASANVKRGQPLVADYGAHNNEHFFLFYGFVQEGNAHDSVTIFESLEEAVVWYLSR